MWFSVVLVKFHWFGINWHVFNQSEYRNCCLYIIIQKITPQAKSGKYYQIWFFPRFGRKKWRRSEHAHASYPGLFFRPPGFSPCMGREERRVQGLDHREHTILLSREKVNKGTKRMNSLPLSPLGISFNYLTRFYWENRCLRILRNTVALNLFLGLSALSKKFFRFV